MIFKEFPKIPRFDRECIVTEKIDGTNALVEIVVEEDRAFWGLTPGAVHELNGYGMSSMPPHIMYVTAGGVPLRIFAGSRNRYIYPGKTSDNFGFARWVWDNAIGLSYLGVGQHHGEWWGRGIGRGYGLNERRFSLFNVSRYALHGEPCWSDKSLGRPDCCGIVPVLWQGNMVWKITPGDIAPSMGMAVAAFAGGPSVAAPDFDYPEGVVIFHTASGQLFKQTFDGDGHKGGAR